MKIRYRHKFEQDWVEYDADNLDSFFKMLSKSAPSDSYEIRLFCDHSDTFVENGIRICKKCGDSLAVTTYRD